MTGRARPHAELLGMNAPGILAMLAIAFASYPLTSAGEDRRPAQPTREFEIRGDRPFLGGQPVDLWGLRCANALYSTAVTERHINNLDSMVALGINLIGV